MFLFIDHKLKRETVLEWSKIMFNGAFLLGPSSIRGARNTYGVKQHF